MSFVNKSINIPDLIEFDFNITDISIKDMKLDNKSKLIELGDNQIILNIKNFTGDFHSSYMYISNPPMFADIGDFDFNITNFGFMTDFKTNMTDSDVL